MADKTAYQIVEDYLLDLNRKLIMEATVLSEVAEPITLAVSSAKFRCAEDVKEVLQMIKIDLDE
jgi:hypothetical protein